MLLWLLIVMRNYYYYFHYTFMSIYTCAYTICACGRPGHNGTFSAQDSWKIWKLVSMHAEFPYSHLLQDESTEVLMKISCFSGDPRALTRSWAMCLRVSTWDGEFRNDAVGCYGWTWKTQGALGVAGSAGRTPWLCQSCNPLTGSMAVDVSISSPIVQHSPGSWVGFLASYAKDSTT